MKISVVRRCTLEFNAIRVVAVLRHAPEDAPNGMFGLVGDTLSLVLNLDDDACAAMIRGWTGPAMSLHSKVCDRCSVYLLNGDDVVASREDDYVPAFMPGTHYGDYLILDIDEDGRVLNWRRPSQEKWQAFHDE